MTVYYFYGFWDYRFLCLILFSSCVDYGLGILIDKSDDQRRRKMLLLASVFLNLGLLGFFKYYNFFVESFQQSFQFLGLHLGTMDIILPVGISFYTFQTMSYTVDIYRNKFRPCRDFLDFCLFVSFFPQLVAGPIVRASEFLPQLYTERKITGTRVYYGCQQFIFGLFKKVFIADRLAFFVDNVFENYSLFDSGTIWLAVVCYSIQIYCDFSGYSDMAIGVARTMGYDFNANFNLPYLATSIESFWRRWHISLSSWLRDYVYIPLGGSRLGEKRTYLNLMATMLIGGLWHGAAWTFLFWGFWHGLALAVNRYAKRMNGISHIFPPKIAKAINWVITANIVVVGWVLFRSSSFSQAAIIIRKMYVWEAGISWYYGFALFAAILMTVYHMFHLSPKTKVLLELPPDKIRGPAVLFSMVLLTMVFYPEKLTPFIYFQF